jgi:aminoglycoside phosphotransferase (APT) family kinase protein
MDPLIRSIMTQIPAWQKAHQITVEPQKGGLTNANYLLAVDGERFVLRLSGNNTAQLGIHRQTERDALMTAENARIAPEVVLFALPEGHSDVVCRGLLERRVGTASDRQSQRRF